MAGRDEKAEHVELVMRTLARAIDGLDLPAVEKIAESQQEDPFRVLIATSFRLALRTPPRLPPQRVCSRSREHRGRWPG